MANLHQDLGTTRIFYISQAVSYSFNKYLPSCYLSGNNNDFLHFHSTLEFTKHVHMYDFIKTSKQRKKNLITMSELDMVIPILEMRKLELREEKPLSQGSPARKKTWWWVRACKPVPHVKAKSLNWLSSLCQLLCNDALYLCSITAFHKQNSQNTSSCIISTGPHETYEVQEEQDMWVRGKKEDIN